MKAREAVTFQVIDADGTTSEQYFLPEFCHQVFGDDE